MGASLLLFAGLLSWLSIGGAQVVRRISDWALCNNGPALTDPYRGYDCTEGTTCDDRVVPETDCLGFYVKLTDNTDIRSSVDKLRATFTLFDSNSTIRRLHFEYPPSLYEALTVALDEELTPRPWVLVQSERYPWESINGTKEEREQPLWTTIDKYHHGFENRLRQLGATEYPDGSTCEKAALMVSRHDCIHPGYASAIGMYEGNAESYPFSVLAIYASESNTLNDFTAFIGPQDGCPHLNRWLCAFLPSTNCTLPTSLTTCKDSFQYEKCILKPQETSRFAAIYYNHSFMTHDNKTLIAHIENQMRWPLNKLQDFYWKQVPAFTGPVIHYVHPRHAPLSYSAADHASAPEHHRHHFTRHKSEQAHHHLVSYNPIKRNPFSVIFQNLYMMRHNARFRALIARQLRQFAVDYDLDGLYGYHRRDRSRQQQLLRTMSAEDPIIDARAPPPPLPSTASRRLANQSLPTYTAEQPFRCVAVHMRRGDRTLKDLNESALLKYCQENKDSAAASDKGCRSVPFQLITLPYILHAASTLVDVRQVSNLILLSDDDQWAVEETEKLYKNSPESPWKVHVMLAPWNADRNFTNTEERWQRYGRTGRHAGVHFFSSLQLVRQCEAFVGHFDSAATHIVSVSMCMQHGPGQGRQASCPPVFDIRHYRSLYN